MKGTLSFFGLLVLSGLGFAQLTNTENYIYSKTYLNHGENGQPIKTEESVTYFDGLGRQKQIIAVKASSSGKDIVTPITYDAFGRQALDILPIPIDTKSNGFHPNISELNANSYYSGRGLGGTAFAEKKYENSPLDRVLEQANPGDAWKMSDGKTIKFAYETNFGDNVINFTTTITPWNDGATNSNLQRNSYYADATLYKNKVSDEDGNLSIEFKNGQGQTLLIRKNDGIENVETYYVYNEFNHLVFVLSPSASKYFKGQPSGTSFNTETDPILNELCYQYRYDGKNRLIEKKVPGKGFNPLTGKWEWEYLVYDKADRLILTQDANMRTSSGTWLLTKYDKFGRIIFTGITPGGTRITMQNGIKDLIITEERTVSGFVRNGLTIYYTNGYFTSISDVLSVNYYDTYPTDSPTIPTTILLQPVLEQPSTNVNISTQSLPTASLLKNIENNNWTKSYTFYDKKGRPIGNYSANHLGGYTKTETALDFAGVPQQSFTYHNRLSTTTPQVTIEENFTYDPHNNALVKHEHKVNSNPTETLTENTYNEIGQLVRKKVGNDMQEMDYTYNIRGWMTKINNPKTIGTKLFAYEIRYNNPENPTISPAKFNGNIAEVDWIGTSGILKRYGYQYDSLDRILQGIYQEANTAPAMVTHDNDEIITYDLNGNIKMLNRFTKGKNTPFHIDNLTYHYENNENSNRLLSITDATNNKSGYEGGGITNTYDLNGNMTAMMDKGISAIVYNFLNLPTTIAQKSNISNYLYRADGAKLKKTYNLVNATGVKVINTEYLDGFQYSTPNTEPIRKALEEQDENTMSVAKAGNEEAFSSVEGRPVVPGNPPVIAMNISFFPTTEGFYDYENFRYIYQYKDQLGNVRVSFIKNSAGDPEVTDTNDYYPFGLSFLKQYNSDAYYDPMAIPYNYKYQGQELQETGFYSFKWRNYMPDVGRFTQIDPLSTKYPYNSTYAFQENKLGMGVELEGLELLLNHTGFFAINGNVMEVKQAPISQTYIGRSGARHASFTPGDIGLTTGGYNPDGARVSSGTTGLKQDSYKYSGPVPDAAQFQDIPGSTSGQSFKTTKRGLPMTNNAIKSLNVKSSFADGLKEIGNLILLGLNIPDAMKSLAEYPQAADAVKSVDNNATQMGRAIKYVDESGISMSQQTRNDTVNYIYDGQLPKSTTEGVMSNSLIKQIGAKIMNANNIPIQQVSKQLGNIKNKL